MGLWRRLMQMLGRKPLPNGELHRVNEQLEHFDRALDAERRRRKMQLEVESHRRLR